jgi:hypothetical protein
VRRRRIWFSIVATDMFSGAFAAIVLVDAVTPKQILRPILNEPVELSYEKSNKYACPADGSAIVFSFRDGNDVRSTLKENFQVNDTGSRCTISGTLSMDLTGEPEKPCVTIFELRGAEPPKIDVDITGLPWTKDLRVGQCS